MLQMEGSLSDVFQIQIDAIKKACEMLFSAYSDVRISIIAYTPMSLMYFLSTDIGSSVGTNQRYLTTIEEVDARWILLNILTAVIKRTEHILSDLC